MSQDDRPSIDFAQILLIGENEDWQFCVGKAGDRWWGFAIGESDRTGHKFMNVFSGVGEGFELGLRDRDAAILKTGAIACDANAGFGGILRWYVDAPLRGDPEDFRCTSCGDVDCDGVCCDDEFDFGCEVG